MSLLIKIMFTISQITNILTMKRFRSYFILVLAATIMSGCSGLNKMKKNADQVQYEVTPKVLETHGGLVNVTIKGTFPENFFDKKSTLTATPVITYNGGETAFEKVQVVQGESVQANNQVISRSGGSYTYTNAIPYKDAMKISELVLRVKASRGAKSVDFDPVKLADGVIATSTLVEKEGKAIASKDNFQRIIPESQVADIHYLINRADIRSAELKGEDINQLKNYIKEVESDPNRELKGAVVSSYASPDGEFDFNEELSGKRGTAADKFIKREFEKVEDAKNPDFFDALTTPEDWDGFKAEVEKSTLSDKDLILRVLSMYSDPAVREKEIKNMASAFEALKSDILPKLRRSKMTINVDKVGRSDAQILSAMRSNPSELGLEEMLYSGTLTQDASEQVKFYQAASQAYPKCFRAANNAGVTLMELGRVDEAQTEFEKARAIQNNDVAKNNLGFVALVKGDLNAAEEAFNSMTAASAESRWGLGVIAITKGQYDQAVNNLGNEPSVNLALAQILKGDASRAKATLDAIKVADKSGKASYLKAVAGARLDDKNYMINGLKAAVQADASWKGYAKTDLEFAKYFTDSAFTSVVQ